MDAERTRPRIGLRWGAGAAAAYLLGAIALTWPLALHLRDTAPSTYKDVREVVYVLAWDAHVLRTDPTDLFQAPFFWPEHDAGTYHEHAMGLGILAAPIIWATGNPYLAHNLLFIGSIAFAAWAAFILGFELTGSRSAALVSGAVFGFAPYWFGSVINLSHLQTLAAGWMPMAFVGLLRWVRDRGVGALVLTTASFVMAALTSWYQLAFLAVGLVVALPFLALAHRPLPWRRMAIQGIAAAAVAAIMIAPFGLPYRRAQTRFENYSRNLADSEHYGARLDSFLAAPDTNVLYGDLTARWRAKQPTLETTLFPGVVTVALALTGLLSARKHRRDRYAIAASGGVLILGLVLSLGGGEDGIRRFLPWTFLFDHVVVFQGLRAAARAHTLTLIGASSLVAFGARSIMRVLNTRPQRVGIGLALSAVVALEGAAVPVRLGAAVRPAAAHLLLASRPGAVLELPSGFRVPGKSTWSHTRAYDVDYMVMGAAHWRPLVNGYAGFEPPSYRTLMESMATLPDAQSLSLLRRIGVRTIVIHRDLLRRTPWAGIEERMKSAPGVRLILRRGRTIVYDVSPGADAAVLKRSR